MIIWPTPRPAVRAAVDILETAFPAVTVSTRMPTTRPSQFVKVDRVGGRQPNPRFDVARILVELWATDYGTAETMAGTAREALRNAGGTIVAADVFIHAWNEDNVVRYDDLDVPSHRRFQVIGELQVSTRVATGGS